MSTTTTTTPPPRKEGLEADGEGGPEKRGSLYVGDLSPEVTESDLLEKFGEMGKVASVRVCSDAVTGKSLCYAYVNFFRASHASKALACLNHSHLKGKPMRIMWSQRNPATRKTGNANLFVKNLHPNIDSRCLHKIFGQFGPILSCKVAQENGRSKGFGFVQFDSEESAVNALNALHDSTLAGKKIYVSKFVKKSERQLAGKEPKLKEDRSKKLQDHQLHPGSQPFLPSYLNAHYSSTRHNFGLPSLTHTLLSQPVPFTYQYVQLSPNILMTEDSVPPRSSAHFSGRSMKMWEGNIKERNFRQSFASAKYRSHGYQGGLKSGSGESVNISMVPPASPAALPEVKTGENLNQGRDETNSAEMDISELEKMLQGANLSSAQASSSKQVPGANPNSNVEEGTGW